MNTIKEVEGNRHSLALQQTTVIQTCSQKTDPDEACKDRKTTTKRDLKKKNSLEKEHYK